MNIGEVTVLHNTGKAMKIELPDGEELWVPLSVILSSAGPVSDGLTRESEAGEIGELSVKDWFAEKEGLDDFDD